MNKITRKQLENWLGSDDQLNEALETLVDLANGNYDLHNLKHDVLEYNELQENKKTK